jgi:taurine transport system substrate-binding protein
MNLFIRIVIGLTCLLKFFTAFASEISIGYQTGIDPSKLAIANGEYQAATDAKINWRKFDNGAELIRAMVAGDIDIGNVGSSVVATAASRRLSIITFQVATELGQSEALVVRNNSAISRPEDLIGKTVAAPFVSTAHYSLLSALQHWGIDFKKVKIINMRVSEIAAAWQRGDIDAAYVWEPGLGKIKETGTVLATSAEVGQWGAPTFDLWVVRRDFAEKNVDFLVRFVTVSMRQYEKFKANPAVFSNDQENLNQIARVTGAKTTDIKTILNGENYPVKSEQARLLGEGYVAKALADTAHFLKAQGQLDTVLPDYSGYVSNRFILSAGP